MIYSRHALTAPKSKNVSATSSGTVRCCAWRLTHPSIAHEQNNPSPHNQRLEFLGDAILGAVLSQQLYEKFPEADEGLLTKSRAKLVNASSLAAHGRALGLGGI